MNNRGSVFSQGGMNCEYELYTHTGHQETLQDTLRNTPGCIFPCYGHFLSKKSTLDAFLAPVCTP